MSNHMKTLLALVSLAVCAAPVARAYEVITPVSVSPVDSDWQDLSTPALPVPQIYALPTAPSVLDTQPKQTTCVQMTYGFNCYSR
jgi:hypothetical protein